MANTTMNQENSIVGLFATLIAWIFTRVPQLSEMAGVVTIMVGITTLFINYPKILERINSIKQKFKRKK